MDRVRGEALFFRAFSLFYALQYWSEPYDSATAAGLPGVPLRLTSDINEAITRPPLKDCYARVKQDLSEAAALLPATRLQLWRPSRAAALGMLARLYLVMGRYAKALACADTCLQLYPVLMDYNDADPAAATPFKSLNDEVIFHAETLQPSSIFSPTAKTDTLLYDAYAASDLRKQLFFYPAGGYHSFKGSYAGSTYYDEPFIGIATDEQYLIRA